MKRFTIALITATSLCAIAPLATADDDAADDNISIDAVPQAARDTIKREVKTGTITEIEREDEGGRVFFEVEYKDGNKRFELHVAENGKLLLRKAD